MFSIRELESIDREYFNVIVADDYDLTIMSRNTGHFWYLHSSEYPKEGTVIIYHRHKGSHPYHLHGRANNLHQAVRSIERHDRWQMKNIHMRHGM